MEMLFELQCPNCGHGLRIPVKYLGKRGQCVKCHGAVDTSVNMRLKGGGTLLHNAVQKGDPNLVEFLLSAGADPNARDDAGITPLDAAKTFGQDNIASILLEKGANEPPPLPGILDRIAKIIKKTGASQPAVPVTTRHPSVGGLIGYYKLNEWWITAFTEAERNLVSQRFSPLGDRPGSLTEGHIDFNSQTAVAFLTLLAGWFNSNSERYLANRMLEKAQQLANSGKGRDIMDLHLLYMAEIQTNYKDRDKRPDALQAAINACYAQIEISEKVRCELLRAWGPPMPTHVGFKQLCIIREKQGEYAEVIELCERAKKEGWGGDWDKRILRCRKKLSKQKPT